MEGAGSSKRPRASTPPVIVPMVEGIEEAGFRLRSSLIQYPQPETMPDSADVLRGDISDFMAEVVAVQISAENSNSFDETYGLVEVVVVVGPVTVDIPVEVTVEVAVDVIVVGETIVEVCV